MTQLGKSNLNLNLNLNLGAANPAADGGAGTRINTQEFRKVADPKAFPFLPGSAAAIGPIGLGPGQRIAYREFWDGELQAYVYLNEFVTKNSNWLPEIKRELEPLERQLRATIDQELVAVLDAAPERESRFAEIIQQHTAEGAISYWHGMLMLDPSYAPATCLLIRVARRVGELVGMCLKHEFRFPRPSQLCPAIVPMVDPPAHPSFPSGHALQGRLISLVLKDVRGVLPQANELLDELAERVALNRTIAGLHYLKDNRAGVLAAEEVHERLKGGDLFTALVRRAKRELYTRDGSEPPEE
jgi:hypothetical protein